MIRVELASALRDAGLRWRPAAGDRFVIPQPGLDGEVFTLSEMTIEAHEFASGTVLGFNGTTEWALDSVDMEDALWLPREDQLREALGGTFVALTAPGAEDGATDWTVLVRRPDGTQSHHRAAEPADAYGSALLALIAEVRAPVAG